MSVSSVSFTTDVNIRYDRLFNEYAKVSERTHLEAELRKVKTENESLTFRNDQLVKRVERLQDELESIYPFDASLEALPCHIKMVCSTKPRFTWVVFLLCYESLCYCKVSYHSYLLDWRSVHSYSPGSLDSWCCFYQFISFLSVFAELDMTFSTRWALESRFPTATKRICCIGTATSHCLSRLVSESSKLAARARAVNELVRNVFSRSFYNIEFQVDYLKEKISTLESEREGYLVDLSLLRRKLTHMGVKEVK
ncbi:unnamed protein product [Angiostrongylus costaricensis]|uniref:KLRAQ domain-containing protein n=1 Tax=Angiostrongylus costaricensis TaxID=334426 RepID=A0A0R3PBF3_ANGCS|nr:unnamed protein product [Angiostrongylus costaricensis]